MILTILCLLPLAGAVVVAVSRQRLVAPAVAVVTLVIAAASLHAGAETHTWIGSLGVHWALGLDGMGRLLVMLTAALVPIVLLAALRDERHRPSWYAWALALEACALVVFLAQDVFTFYVFFEASLIPAYFLIGLTSGRAALKFLVFQIAGGLVLLGGVVGLYALSARAGAPSFLISDLQHVAMSGTDQRWLFAAFFVACAVKAPLFPLHTWLADTTGEATPPTSVLLVCVLDKIGTFAMIRYCLGLFPDASRWATPVVVAVALVSILYGAVRAIGEDDILRLIGLTSLSHFGLITLGIFVATQEGFSGAVSYMFNHGVATGALFLIAAVVIRRTGTASIREMAGVEGQAPVLAGFFLVAGLATAGLPGLSPFVSELLVVIGAFEHHWYVGTIAAVVIVLAAVYVLRAYQLIFTGRPRAGGRGVLDLSGVERWVLAPPLIALLLFGFWPRPLLDQAQQVPTYPVPVVTLDAAGGH